MKTALFFVFHLVCLHGEEHIKEPPRSLSAEPTGIEWTDQIKSKFCNSDEKVCCIH